jgi:hypothetical protein
MEDDHYEHLSETIPTEGELMDQKFQDLKDAYSYNEMEDESETEVCGWFE